MELGPIGKHGDDSGIILAAMTYPQNMRILARRAASLISESRNLTSAVQRIDNTIGTISGIEHLYSSYLAVAISNPEYYESASVLLDEIGFSQTALFAVAYDLIVREKTEPVVFLINHGWLMRNTLNELRTYVQLYGTNELKELWAEMQ